eukprot:Tbor_TRINITY_DN669_c0_g1::TRINITY_DN669_c0_g1_i1::g.1627::m.1627
MSSIPRAAQIRREAAARREAHLTKNASEGDGPARVPRGQFYNTNRSGYSLRQVSDRRNDYISSAELEMAMEARNNSGTAFRKMFMIGVVFVIGLLVYFKYDDEFNIEVPQIESGMGFGEVTEDLDGYVDADKVGDAKGAKTGSAYSVSQEEINNHLRTLGVKGDFKIKAVPKVEKVEKVNKDPSTPTNEATSTQEEEDSIQSPYDASDPDLARRLEMFRTKKEIKKAMDSHSDKFGQLVTCGRACTSEHQQITTAYESVNSVLPREVFKTVLGTKDTKSGRYISPSQLKEKYTQNIKEIEKIENEEVREMALTEMKEAYEILRSPDARRYYQLYGRKPPEHMKHTKATHGGWGQELYLGSYKYRIIFAILDYFHNSWGETIVLSLLLGLLLARFPSILAQTMKMKDVLEAQEDLDELTIPE